MWDKLTEIGGVTNTVTLPTDGVVSVVIPEGTELCAYINGNVAPMHHLHVKGGDSLYFELKGHTATIPTDIEVTYNGSTHKLAIEPMKLSKSASLELEPIGYNTPVSVNSTVSTMEPEIIIAVPEVSVDILAHKLKKLKKKIKEIEMTPAETINLFANPGMGSGVGAGAGAGLGAGLLGGVLGGALLGNRGLLGTGAAATDVVGAGVVTPALLAASLAQVTDTAQNTTVLQTLGDIKASIPLAEGQVQLALAQNQASLTQVLTTNASADALAGTALSKQLGEAIATSLASQGAIKETVLSTGAANLAATLNAKFELANAIRNDGDNTRALIIAQNDAQLNRELAVAQSALLEQRAIGRSRDVEVNVTQTVAQNQVQLQQQQQQQQQFLITNNLLQAILSQAQIAQATNQQLIIGNTGAVAGGPQTANPVNVRA